MGNVGTGFSMSLDGFVAGPNDDVSKVFAWMFAGDTEVKQASGDTDLSLKVSEESAEIWEQAQQAVGALIAGRRLFDVAGAWGGKHPLDVPVVVMTHHPPQEWLNKEGSPFTFVTDGIESALATARKLAGNKNVVIASPSVLQQAIKVGALEEIHIDLVPVLLGDGIRLIDHLDTALELKTTQVNPQNGVIHMTFSVVK
jgi:dihydrofolate reductase